MNAMKNSGNAPEALFFDDFEQVSEKVRGKVALIDGVLHISEDLKGNLDMVALVARLRRRGIPFGVVSSSWRWYVEHCLRELGMYEDAAVIVTGSDGLPLKPAPAPYQAAARVFRPAPPGAVLAVEDSGSGVRSAVAAGLACAAVYNPDSGAQDLSPARWRLNSLYELPALLDGN